MWIGVEEIAKSYRGELLFDDVTMQVNPGDRIAIIGPNGCGKTTLLNILAGRIQPEAGERRQKKDLEIGMIDQLPDYRDETVYEAARRSFTRLFEIERRLEEIDELLTSVTDSEKLNKILHEQEDLMLQFERLGGYSMEATLEKVLKGVGLRVSDFEKQVPDLSGGEKRRLAFASLLLAHPDVLLLDEPTNHLDIEAIKWTEDFLKDYDGALVVVSHDRVFLDKITTHTVELRGHGANHYSGNYSFYLQEREVRYELAMKAYETQQEEIARQEDIIARLHANPKLNVAQSRKKKLDKIERLEKPVPPPRGARFHFQNKNPKGNLAIEGEDLTHYYGDQMLFKDLTLRIEPGERVAFVGPNGAGKTTLMKILATKLEPKGGQVKYGKTTTFGYFSQERGDLPEDRTVLQVMQDAYPKEDRSVLQDFLALFLFGKEDFKKEVYKLSGGEQSKLAMARILYSEPNLLALDEPTNHLDIPTCQNLEESLKDFPGTLLFVSHDRYFINKLARRIFYIKNGEVRPIQGNYDYLEEILEREAAEEAAREEERQKREQERKKRQARSQKGSAKKRSQKKKKKGYRGSLQQLEREIIELEERMEELNEKMGRPEIYQDGEKMKKIKGECDEIQDKLDELNEYWENMV